MRAGLTIGEFATVTHLSIRTLRRYHQAGLLEPATIDPSTGYRYYVPDQIPTAQVIHRLRQLDVPLVEVRSILAADDPQQRANELFTHGAGAMTVFRPVRSPRRAGRVEVVELPPADLAVTVHAGPHDDIDVTYGRLGAWVVTHALAVDGPIQETYAVGPRDVPEPRAWRTEIGWPVFRLDPA